MMWFQKITVMTLWSYPQCSPDSVTETSTKELFGHVMLSIDTSYPGPKIRDLTTCSVQKASCWLFFTSASSCKHTMNQNMCCG